MVRSKVLGATRSHQGGMLCATLPLFQQEGRKCARIIQTRFALSNLALYVNNQRVPKKIMEIRATGLSPLQRNLTFPEMRTGLCGDSPSTVHTRDHFMWLERTFLHLRLG